MPSYPAKPYVLPHDDWFSDNSSNCSKKSKDKEIKNISTIHEFFYRQSDVKVGGSENHIQTNFGKKSSIKRIITFPRNSDDSFSSRNHEQYNYSQIPTEVKSIKKRSFHEKSSYKNLSNKKINNFKSYILDIKSVFLKLFVKKSSLTNNAF